MTRPQDVSEQILAITLREASRPVRSKKVAILCPEQMGSGQKRWRKHESSAVSEDTFFFLFFGPLTAACEDTVGLQKYNAIYANTHAVRDFNKCIIYINHTAIFFDTLLVIEPSKVPVNYVLPPSGRRVKVHHSAIRELNKFTTR